MVTGVWHGKVAGQKAEVKLIKSGDSITGTSYYYASASNYRRYTIKGYFDERTNQAVWWDDRLIEEKSGGLFSTPGKVPLLSRADYNCPGSGVMKLDGSSNEKNEEIKDGEVHLEKTSRSPVFTDEWDWVIDNFTVGTNDPYIIDSVSLVAFHPTKQAVPKAEPPVAMNKKPSMVFVPSSKEKAKDPEPIAVVPPQKNIEQKFTARTKKIFTTIPLTGDSITLSFYDNAIVDGDSISLFLDGRMLFTHIKLDSKPYNIKLAVADLKSESELVMVAENLGAIPPNTSYMVAMVGDKRYAANLASTEESSAVVVLKKPAP
ncbi:hypothetical protein [Flavisolibacter ginsenosidimutans]|uniref:Uncharacterized protein n=1 Tax=Flavisolibacter ginsenosidimutans TaxID=661481 RepID=A0A5B8ULH7_9BACT|nr:hypothetical protein [Flavisolibacter ginsenosidimutans]QEC57524.1 hypothetical protein FSB75_16990 [Flavisolibacter ginsenosidimutans]